MPKLLKAPVRLAKRVSRTVKRVFNRQKSSKKSVDELLDQHNINTTTTTANTTTTTTIIIAHCDGLSPSSNHHHHHNINHPLDTLTPTSNHDTQLISYTGNATSSSERKRKLRTDGRILSWWRRLRGKGVKRDKSVSRSASFQAPPPLSLNRHHSTDNHMLPDLPCDSDTATTSADCNNNNHMATHSPQTPSNELLTSHDLVTTPCSLSSKLLLSDSSPVPPDKSVSSTSSASSSSISNATPCYVRRSTSLSRLSLRRLSRSVSRRKSKKFHSIILATSTPRNNDTDTHLSATNTLGFARFGQAVVQVRDSMDGHYSDHDSNYIGHGRDLRRYALGKDESSGRSTNTSRSKEYPSQSLPLDQEQQHGQDNESSQASCGVSVNNDLNHNTDDDMPVNAKHPAAPFTPPMNTAITAANTASILPPSMESSHSNRDTLLFESRRASSVAPALPVTPVRPLSTMMDTHIDENNEFLSKFSVSLSHLLLNQEMEKDAVQSYDSLTKSYNYNTNDDKHMAYSNDNTAVIENKEQQQQQQQQSDVNNNHNLGRILKQPMKQAVCGNDNLASLSTTISVYAQGYFMSPSQLALTIPHKEETKLVTTTTIKEVASEDKASDKSQSEDIQEEEGDTNQFAGISNSNDTVVDRTTSSLWGDTLVMKQEPSTRTTVNEITFEKEVHSNNDSLTELISTSQSVDSTELELKNNNLSSTDGSILYDDMPFDSVESQETTLSTIQDEETFDATLPSPEEEGDGNTPVLHSRFSLSIERSNSIHFESTLENVDQLELPTVDTNLYETKSEDDLMKSSSTIDMSFNLADTFMVQLNSEEDSLNQDTIDDELYEQFYNELLHNTIPSSDPTDPEEASISNSDATILTTDDCPELTVSCEESTTNLPISYTTLKASDDAIVSISSPCSTTDDIQRSPSAPAYSGGLPPRPRRFIRRIASQDGELRSLPTRPSTGRRNVQGSTYRALHQRASSASDALLGCISQMVSSTASVSASSSRRPSLRGIATSVLPQFAQRSISSVSTIVSNAITTATTMTATTATDSNDNNQLSTNIDSNIESDNTLSNICRQRITTTPHTMTSDRNESASITSVDVPSASNLKTAAQSLITITYLKFVTLFWVCLIIMGICLRVASAGIIFGPNYLVKLTGFICRTINDTLALW